MKTKVLFFILTLLGSLAAKAQTVLWENGYWYNGKEFEKRSFYSVNGELKTVKPKKVDQTIDLKGQYIIPPLADAHHHGIDSEAGLQEKINTFLRDGVFYVKNPNVIPDLLTPVLRASINKPTSIDVVFSNGGLTATGGHPVRLHNFLAGRGVFGELKPEDMENRAYYIIDSENDLEKKWSLIVSKNPDFIKTFVLFTDGSERKKREGLTPEVLKAVVSKAHHDKLRVSAHIETALDFKYAVEASVDEINHLPIPRNEFDPTLEAFRIAPTVAKLAAEKRISVVATVKDAVMRRDTVGLKASIQIEKYNAQLLFSSGVNLTIGSDGISGEKPMATALASILYMAKYNFFDNATLLRIATQNTPGTIFPDRKIGFLKNGYEANFLVFKDNPVNEIKNLKNITMRVKQGVILKDIMVEKAPDNKRITFTLKGFENAREVAVAGTFNGWSPMANLMKKEGNIWTVTLDVEQGKVLYKFVVDRQWMTDPENSQTEKDDENTNSVLIIK